MLGTVKITNERTSTVQSSGGSLIKGGGSISAITLYGGTAATGATVIINDSTDGSGSNIWELGAAQYKSESVTFTKPIPFSSGIYINLTPSGATARVSIAYE